MQYCKLPGSDIDVSVICQGCWSIIGGYTWGDQDRRDSERAIAAALDAGINFFDTAPAYGDGESEAILGRVLEGSRKDVVLATKVRRQDLAPVDVKRSCEKSLGLLKTDRIDLLQVHWPNPEIPLDDTVAAMMELRDEGKIRHLGVCNFGVGYLQDLPREAEIVSNQLAYNLLFRAIEHAVMPASARRGMGILAYSPIAQGLLAGKFASADEVPPERARTRHFSKDRPEARHREPGCEDELFRAIGRIRRIASQLGVSMVHLSLAWLIAREGVTAAIAGARNPDQACDNAAAGDVKLSDDTLVALDEATRGVKEALGENADMWQTDSRMEKV